MAITIDGSGATNTATGTTSVSATITTTLSNDVILAFMHEEKGGGYTTFTGVSGGGLTWTRRFQYQYTGASYNTVELWWAVAATPLSGVTVTATMGATIDGSSIQLIAIHGANTSAPFDVNASLPAKAATYSANIWSIPVSTTAANTILLGFGASGNGPTFTVGTGFTFLYHTYDPSSGLYSITDTEYQLFTSAQTSYSATYGSTMADSIVAFDAIVAASTAPAEVSKLNSYSVLINTDDRVSKLNAYAVLLSPGNPVEVTKLNAYAVLVTATPPPHLVNTFTPSSLRSNYGGTVGYQFVPTANLTITSLGLIGGSGTTGARNVYLNQGATILATASVNLTGVAQGAWTYTAISPVTLIAGTTYALNVAVVADSVQNWADSAPITLNNCSSWNAIYFGGSPPNGGWNIYTANQGYFGIDAIYNPLTPGTIELSTQFAEIITSGSNPQIELSNQFLEVIGSGQPPIRLSNQFVEVIADPAPNTSTGTLAFIEPPDIISINGSIIPFPVSGTLSYTEDPDAFHFIGGNLILGTFTFTELPDTISISGSVYIRVTLAYTEPPDTVSINGAILNPISGTLAFTEPPDTIFMTGGSPATGIDRVSTFYDEVISSDYGNNENRVSTLYEEIITSDYNSNWNRISNIYKELISTDYSSSNKNRISALYSEVVTGILPPVIHGIIAFTEPPDTVTFNGIVYISGTLNILEPPDIINFNGVLELYGTLIITESPDEIRFLGPGLTYICTGPFPAILPTGPLKPTGLTAPIQSYLYQEYSDDSDLQAFVSAYNSMQQDIVDTFNGLNLPNYTQNPVNGIGIDAKGNPTTTGGLLDWVGAGVYGYPRPSVSTEYFLDLGPYNTCQYNEVMPMAGGTETIYIPYNGYRKYYPANQVVYNDDDFYRRCLTWHLSKRLGKYFSVEWLKKHVMTFLYGEDGQQPVINQACQISVTFGPRYEVTIRFVLGIRWITNAAMYNENTFMYNSLKYNEIETSYEAFPPLPYMQQFYDAVKAGVLELPFQYKFDVVIG